MQAVERSWEHLISEAMLERPSSLVATKFLHRWSGASQATLLSCSDGNDYVVKSQNNFGGLWRRLFNEHIAAKLGALIGAPVPEVAFVDVPKALIEANSNADHLGHAEPGLAHGSRFISGLADIETYDVRLEGNRDRFSALAVFFSWMHDDDRQYHYLTTPPFHVFSVDHGEYFFGGGPEIPWSIDSLANAPPADLADLFEGKLVKTDLSEPIDHLRQVTKPLLATILATPPPEWNVTLDERVAMAKYLWRRREELLLCIEIPE